MRNRLNIAAAVFIAAVGVYLIVDDEVAPWLPIGQIFYGLAVLSVAAVSKWRSTRTA